MPRFACVFFALRPSLRFLLVLGLLTTGGGCGGSLGQVTGRVTYQGQPAAGAQIVLRSQEKPEVICRGISVADGSFQVDYGAWEGIPPGSCRIEVAHQTLPDGRPAPGGEEGAALRAAGKLRTHQVSFTRDIAAGANEIHLEITEGEPMNPTGA